MLASARLKKKFKFQFNYQDKYLQQLNLMRIAQIQIKIASKSTIIILMM